MVSKEIRKRVLQKLRESVAFTDIANELGVPFYYVQVLSIYNDLCVMTCLRCELTYAAKTKQSRYCASCRLKRRREAAIASSRGRRDPTPEEIKERAAEIRKRWIKPH